MGSANGIPICLSGYDASDIRWVVPVPGLTGLAITSRRSHNLMEPIDRLQLFLFQGLIFFTSLHRKVRSMAGSIDLTAHHDRPDHTGHLVRHGHTRYPHRFPAE